MAAPRTTPRATTVVAVAAAVTLAACSGSSTSALTPTEPAVTGAAVPTAATGEQIGVSLIVKTLTNPYFVAMEAGADEAAAAAGVRLTKAAGASDGDQDAQIAAIQAAVARKDKGILITPSGPRVLSAIKKARVAGIYVIALDTVPIPRSSVDITFATNNREAGNLVGSWTAGRLAGKRADIALLDLYHDRVVSVDYQRDQGFLAGLGVDVVDPKVNGDEERSGQYVGSGSQGAYSIVGSEPTEGSEEGGYAAMTKLLETKHKINVVYAVNEPAAYGAVKALTEAGKNKGVLVVSVDGGCDGVRHVQDGTLSATSQQYPVVMAQKGVEAIKTLVTTGERPAKTDGLDLYDTGTALITDKPISGIASITSADAMTKCWGDR